MAIQSRTMFIESKRKSDGSKRHRVLPFYLVQDDNIGAAFELMSQSGLQRSGDLVSGITDYGEESNKITHVQHIQDEAQLTVDGDRSLHHYDVIPRDPGERPAAGLGVSP